MKLAVCTDQEEQERLRPLLEQIGREFCMESQIEWYDSCRELGHAFQAGAYQAVLLDADMPDSLETAYTMRGGDSACRFILFARSKAAALLGYRIHPEGFLPKPVQYKPLRAVFDRLRQSWNSELRGVQVTSNRVKVRIVFADMDYVEVNGPMLTVYGKYGQVETRMSLAQFEQIARDGPFLRCHRSYLVNLFHVHACQGDRLLLWDGNSVPVSTEKLDQVEAEYRRFQQENQLIFQD